MWFKTLTDVSIDVGHRGEGVRSEISGAWCSASVGGGRGGPAVSSGAGGGLKPTTSRARPRRTVAPEVLSFWSVVRGGKARQLVGSDGRANAGRRRT